jgi:hypothetical protein
MNLNLFREALLASRRVVPASIEVQVHPAALPLDFIVISSRVEQQLSDQRRCVVNGVRDVLWPGVWGAAESGWVVIESMRSSDELLGGSARGAVVERVGRWPTSTE